MRDINRLVIHCTATLPTAKVENIRKYWRSELNWRNDGYHALIDAEGKIHELMPIDQIANGAKGYNQDSVHVAYIGGVVAAGEIGPGQTRYFKAHDTRTPAQRKTLERFVRGFHREHPDAEILGHRDLPGVSKACPSFNVELWLQNIGLSRAEK